MNNNLTEAPVQVEERVCISNEVCAPPRNPYGSVTLPYNIRVDALNIGYILSVGCQTVAVQDKEQLKKLICDYIDNPEEVVKKYTERTLL